MFRKKQVEELKKRNIELQTLIEEYLDIIEPHRYRNVFRNPSEDLGIRIKVLKLQAQETQRKEKIRDDVVEILKDFNLIGKPVGINSQKFAYSPEATDPTDGCKFHSAPEAAE